MTTTPDAVVIGHGPVGAAITARLIEQGRHVRVLTRSGSGPDEAERQRVNVLDTARLAAALGEAPVVHMCFHAPYSAKVWAATLPPMEAGVLAHAARTGARVVTAESLYAFDGGPGPVRETTPLAPRSRKGHVRRTLLEQRERSGARVVSVVSGDFYGPGVLTAHAGERLLVPVLTGRPVRPVGDPDQPHAFTHVPDLAVAMIRAATLDGEGHELVMAPSAGALTMRELAAATARAAGVPLPRVAPLSLPVLRALGLVAPSIREVADVAHQFTAAFVVDARAGERRLGLAATPWERAAAETVAWWRAERPEGAGLPAVGEGASVPGVSRVSAPRA